MDVCDCASVRDIFISYHDESLTFYPEYRTVNDYLRHSIEKDDNASEKPLDYEKYLNEFKENYFIIETDDGLITIEK